MSAPRAIPPPFRDFLVTYTLSEYKIFLRGPRRPKKELLRLHGSVILCTLHAGDSVEVAVLGRMRNHAKTLSVTLWLVIFAFIGTTFLVYGFRSTSSRAGVDTIATVDGEKIPYAEYQQIYRQAYQQYQGALGDKFDEKILERLNLKNQVVEGLVSRHLLLREARRLGIRIGPDELAAEIRKQPVFSDKTGFSRDRYLRTLESAGFSPEKYEESLREDMQVRKIEEWVKAAINLLPDEALEAYRSSKSSVKVQYLLFSDPRAQQATIQRLGALVKEGKPWEEIVKTSGLKPISTDFFSWNQKLKGMPDEDSFKEAALALEKGAISQVIYGAKASYLLRVSERKAPDPAEFEREKNQFSLVLLNRKREQVYADWLRQVRSRAKVKIEQANL